MSLADVIYQIADELRAIACERLRYDSNPYAQKSAERVLAASARLVAALEGEPADEVLAQYRGNMAHLSPLLGAEGVVYRQGKILLIRREDDGLWAVPGGLTEVGETLAESARRELCEETGLRGRVTRLLGIFDSRLWQSRLKCQLYHVIFLVECEDGVPAPGPETTAIGFFGADELPSLSAGHHLRVPFLFRLLRGEVPVPYFDPAGEANDEG